MPTRVWSFGGGVQSAAIAVLVVEGKLPRPEIALMADTGMERSETWDYLRSAIQPFLDRVGLKVEIVPPRYAKVHLWRTGPSGYRKFLPPVFTDFSGAMGQLPTLCSTEWKVRPVRRRLRELGVKRCVQWLGISADEAHRAKDSDLRWITNEYPLLDLRVNRGDCVRMVEAAGLPTPPRSSCWMCPHSGNTRWLDLKRRYPEEFEKAVKVDESLRSSGEGKFLHRSGRPLREAVDMQGEQGDLFNGCDSGMCWT